MKLTDANVARLVLPDGKDDHIEFDDSVPGLGYRMRGSGSRSWVFQYRTGGRQRRLTIGAASALSAAAARATAVKLYARIKLGADPASEKERTRADDTFGAVLLSLYLKHKAERLRPRSFTELQRHLVVHAAPLHRLPFASVTRRDVSKVTAGVAGPVAANRVAASIAAFFAWGVREGLVDNSPAAVLNKRAERPRERVLSDDEIALVWAATGGSDQHSAIVRLLLLTGCRRQEIGGLLWSEIDFDRALVSLPGSRTKNARSREVPLSAPALEILARQPRREGCGGHVFGEGPRGFRGFAQGKAALDKRAPIARWVIHDLRRTVSTVMNGRLGIEPHVVEHLLGHVGGQSAIARVYNVSTYAREQRQAAAIWADHVAALAEGRTAKVVSFARPTQ